MNAVWTREEKSKRIYSACLILSKYRSGIKKQELIKELIQNKPLTDTENGDYPSGRPIFETNIELSINACVTSGWILKDLGQWTITERGRKALQTFSDPVEFYDKAMHLDNEFRKLKHKKRV